MTDKGYRVVLVSTVLAFVGLGIWLGFKRAFGIAIIAGVLGWPAFLILRGASEWIFDMVTDPRFRASEFRKWTPLNVLLVVALVAVAVAGGLWFQSEGKGFIAGFFAVPLMGASVVFVVWFCVVIAGLHWKGVTRNRTAAATDAGVAETSETQSTRPAKGGPMRTARIWFVVVGGLLLLVPPWQSKTGYVPQIGHIGGDAARTALPGGHAFLFTPPEGRSEIALERLAMELAAVAVFTFGVAWATRRE